MQNNAFWVEKSEPENHGICWLCEVPITNYQFGNSVYGKHHIACRDYVEKRKCVACDKPNLHFYELDMTDVKTSTTGKPINSAFKHRKCTHKCRVCEEIIGNSPAIVLENDYIHSKCRYKCDKCGKYGVTSAKHEWLFNNFCSPNHCIDKKCDLCRDTLDDAECTSFRCAKFEFKCKKCNTLIKRGSSPEETCTTSRCFKLQLTCKKCGKNIKYSAESDGCDLKECYTIREEMMKHIEFIIYNVDASQPALILNKIKEGLLEDKKLHVNRLWNKVSSLDDVALGTHLMLRLQRLETIFKEHY